MANPYLKKLKEEIDYFKKYYLINSFQRINTSGEIVNTTTFEEEDILLCLDKIFTQKRGALFNPPKPGNSVIVISSGGFDSVGLWGLLLKKYKLNVYPVYFDTSCSPEREAFKFFVRYYQNLFPDLSKEGYIFKHDSFFSLNSSTVLELLKSNPQMVFANISKFYKRLTPVFSPTLVRLMYFATKSYQYKIYLLSKYKIRIDTIFVGIVPEDAVISRESTLTALRGINLAVSLQTGDFTFQFTSPAMEHNGGFFYTKRNLLNFYLENKIPVEKTRSCNEQYKLHCGVCPACIARRRIFALFKQKDPTQYREQPAKEKLNKISKKINKHLPTLNDIKNKLFVKKRKKKLNDNSVIKIAKNIVIYSNKDKIYIYYLDSKTDKYFAFKTIYLEGSAKLIVLLLHNQPMTIKAIIKNLVSKYYVSEKQVKKDVYNFVYQSLGKYFDAV